MTKALNTSMKISELPTINEDIMKRNMSGDKNYNFNSTIFQMKQGSPFDNEMLMNRTTNGFLRRSSTDKKNWKDTKLYKGNTLSFFKKTNENMYKMKEIKKILDEKNSIIRKQNNEITNLKNTLLSKESELFSKY